MKMNLKKIISLLRSIKNYFFYQEEINKSFLLNKKKLTKKLYQSSISIQNNDITFDEELISRLKTSFLNLDVNVSAHWEDIYNNLKLGALMNQLKENDNYYFHNVMSNPHKTNLHAGFGLFLLMLSNFSYKDFYANKTIYDCLYRICCYLGIEKMPEPYHSINFQHLTADQLIDNIFDHLKLKTNFPNLFAKEKGIKTKYGIISYAPLQQLYHAIRVYELTKKIKQPKVLEIGAGIGMSAYHAWNFGIKNYTIVDLPLTCMCSGFFLANTINKNNICFNEEKNNYPKDSLENNNKIKIISPTKLDLVSNNLDLILNCDSLTEMSRDQAEKYIKFASEKSKFFLSINHEGNAFTINELFNNSSFEKISRMPTWYRQGFVEELYRNKMN